MVKGKTKSGLAYTINEKVKDDARVLYYITAIQKDGIEPLEASRMVFDLLSLIFGDDSGVLTFMNAVAEVNDGCFEVPVLIKELTEMFDAIGAKKY